MARLETMGLDELILDTKELAALPDSVVWNMLEAGGEVIKDAHKKAVSSEFGSPTYGGLITHLKDSISSYHKVKGTLKYILVYPKGAHHTYNKRFRTYVRFNWGREDLRLQTTGGGEATSSNQDVAFVHEFGGHGNDATQWMRKANEQNVGKAVGAEASVYEDWLKSHNL